MRRTHIEIESATASKSKPIVRKAAIAPEADAARGSAGHNMNEHIYSFGSFRESGSGHVQSRRNCPAASHRRLWECTKNRRRSRPAESCFWAAVGRAITRKKSGTMSRAKTFICLQKVYSPFRRIQKRAVHIYRDGNRGERI